MASRYSLQQVLGLKQQIEQQRMLELARAEKERQVQAENLAGLVSELEEQLEVRMSPELLEHRSRFLLCQNIKLDGARSLLAKKTEERDEAQRVLRCAAIERKKFETHKDTHMELFRQEQSRTEQAQGDEAAVLMFVRQGRR